MAKGSVSVIKIKPKPRRRIPHKPTRAFRDRTKYSRKGRSAQRRDKELKENGG